VSRKLSALILTAMAAVPLSGVLVSGPHAADAAAHKTVTKHKHKHKHKKKPTPTPTPRPHKRSKPKPTATPRPTATPTATTLNGTFQGPAVDMRWGPVQATITVQDGKITDVKVGTNPDTSRSQFIDDHAAPLLREETLKAQSANIDLFSGATMTSEAYQQSLSSALHKANM